MRIAIIGAGGVGGYFGARLVAAGEDVTFVARGAHLAALQSTRASAREPERQPSSAEGHTRPTTPRRSVPVDVVLLTVKMYDLESAAANAATAHWPEHRGRDAAERRRSRGHRLRRRSGASTSPAASPMSAAVIAEPGVIRHTSLDALIFGELDGRRSTVSPRLKPRVSVRASARVSATTSRSICGRSSRACRCSAA